MQPRQPHDMNIYGMAWIAYCFFTLILMLSFVLPPSSLLLMELPDSPTHSIATLLLSDRREARTYCVVCT